MYHSIGVKKLNSSVSFRKSLDTIMNSKLAFNTFTVQNELTCSISSRAGTTHNHYHLMASTYTTAFKSPGMVKPRTNFTLPLKC